MERLDLKKQEVMDVRNEMVEAFKGEDAVLQEKAFNKVLDMMQNEIMDEANGKIDRVFSNKSDENVLVTRGIRKAWTADEKKFFNAVIERKGFEGVEGLFPVTIIEEVFNNLTRNHPLLSRIDAKNTTAVTRMIFSVPQTAKAYWGPICEDIKQMVINGFKEVDLKTSRLSGFVAICKGMLELGPDWLGRYVMEAIYEIMNTEFEIGIVTGDGKNKPIGINRKLSGAVDGVYPEKPTTAITAIDAKTFLGVRAALATANMANGPISLLVNPADAAAKIAIASIYQVPATGQYVQAGLPGVDDIVESYAVPVGKAYMGNLKNYFLGIAGQMRIDRYEETLAIEDMTLYIAKMYAYGQPKDMNAFFALDISKVTGITIPALENPAA